MIQISLSNYNNNIKYLKSITDSIGNCILCPVIKSDAYGIGIDNTIRFLVENNIEYVAITENDEAEKIRSFGYKNKIIRLRGCTLEDYAENVTKDLGIEEIIGGDSNVFNLIDKNHPCHIKLSIGINRIGMKFDQEKIIHILKNYNIKGIMIHFPSADDDPDITIKQYNEYIECLQKIKEYINTDIIFHFANTTFFLDYHHLLRLTDKGFPNKIMIRLGAITYGLYGRSKLDLHNQIKPVLTDFKGKIVSIRNMEIGESIGYDLIYTFEQNKIIGVVNLGYNNGVPLSMANQYCYYNGIRCDILGKISMNFIIVDLSSVPNIDIIRNNINYGYIEILNSQRNIGLLANELNTVKSDIQIRLCRSNKITLLIDK